MQETISNVRAFGIRSLEALKSRHEIQDATHCVSWVQLNRSGNFNQGSQRRSI